MRLFYQGITSPNTYRSFFTPSFGVDLYSRYSRLSTITLFINLLNCKYLTTPQKRLGAPRSQYNDTPTRVHHVFYEGYGFEEALHLTQTLTDFENQGMYAWPGEPSHGVHKIANTSIVNCMWVSLKSTMVGEVPQWKSPITTRNRLAERRHSTPIVSTTPPFRFLYLFISIF